MLDWNEVTGFSCSYCTKENTCKWHEANNNRECNYFNADPYMFKKLYVADDINYIYYAPDEGVITNWPEEGVKVILSKNQGE